MSQQMKPPIEFFRTQGDFGPMLETLQVVFKTLIEAYEAVRQGQIIDTKTIRILARQFEAIADNPEASDLFPYDAGRAAAVLYNQALDIGMPTRDQSHTIHTTNVTESSPKTSKRRSNDVNINTEKNVDQGLTESLDKTPLIIYNTQD